jgi:anti-sigma factor RsiW
MMLRQFFQQMGAWHWGYPSDGQLLSLCDGELSDEPRVRIQAHLNQCPGCRERAAQIAQDWKDFAELSWAARAKPVFAEDALTAGIHASIHAWRMANLPAAGAQTTQASAQAEADRQAAAVLGVYIGQRAAHALLHGIDTSQASRQKKLAQAESTLRVLLGRKSAAAVVVKLAGLMGRLSESAGGSSVS